MIKDELLAVKEGFATPRRCQITFDSGDMSIEDLVDDKELVVVMTEAQYVKAVPAGSFKTQARGGRGVAGARLKADDLIRHVIFTTAHAHLLFFSNFGKVYRLRALEIPERERTAKGMPIVNLLPLQPGEKIRAIIDTRDFAGERFLFFATRKGTVKKTAFDAYDSSRRDGLIALNLRPGDELVRVIETGGGDDIFMVSRKGMTIRFNEDDVRPMGRTAAGVRGMRLRTDDEVVSVDVARDDTAILMVTEAGYGKRTQLEHYNTQGRGGQGVIGIKLTGRKGQVVAAFMVGIDDEIVAVASSGIDDPHGGTRDLLAGSGSDRRARDEPRRRPDGRVRRPDPRQRRRLSPPCVLAVTVDRPCRSSPDWWPWPPCWCSGWACSPGTSWTAAGPARPLTPLRSPVSTVAALLHPGSPRATAPSSSDGSSRGARSSSACASATRSPSPRPRLDPGDG